MGLFDGLKRNKKDNAGVKWTSTAEDVGGAHQAGVYESDHVEEAAESLVEQAVDIAPEVVQPAEEIQAEVAATSSVVEAQDEPVIVPPVVEPQNDFVAVPPVAEPQSGSLEVKSGEQPQSAPAVVPPAAELQNEPAVAPLVEQPSNMPPVVSPAAQSQEESTAEHSVADASAEDFEDEPAAAPTLVKQTPIKGYQDKKPVEHEIGSTKILAIINQKGGVGKSTTAINLSAALGEKNRAVLVIDLDPQGNTTSGLGVDKGQVVHDSYDILLGDVQAKDAIIADVCEGLDLIPATINLAGAEVELVNEIARENRLKGALEALRGEYDFIFIDCPPALGLLTVNALVAADELLIPIQTEFYALEGVTKLLDSMKRVKNALNPNLDIFGVLLTMYDGRTTLSRQVAAEVRGFFGDKVFDAMIPRTVRLSEAPSFGQPIIEYDPSGRGSATYRELAKEVMDRV